MRKNINKIKLCIGFFWPTFRSLFYIVYNIILHIDKFLLHHNSIYFRQSNKIP